jgi:hypothetical protein
VNYTIKKSFYATELAFLYKTPYTRKACLPFSQFAGGNQMETLHDKKTQRHCTECGQIRNLKIKDGSGCDHEHGRLASVGKNYCPHCGNCTKCGQIRSSKTQNESDCDHDHLASVGKNYCPHCGKRLC